MELQAHWARYLCVLVSGFVETSVQQIYSQYAGEQSSPVIANFVSKTLSRHINLNMTKIIALASLFDPRWASKIEFDTEGELKAAIDSIAANRNSIAHGQDTGVSLHRIRDWYEKALRVIELVESTCLQP
ncbi:HEPN domain-containing protein [Acidobacteria bacterium AH-259-D05]|nr:HEPN domain-containing protein [Acidobacteria bacterium AH-259-D05]